LDLESNEKSRRNSWIFEVIDSSAFNFDSVVGRPLGLCWIITPDSGSS
jgi:hypothetical protein